MQKSPRPETASPDDADGRRPPFAAERQERILRLLAERGRVRTAELAVELEVTEPTVRKDIIDLAAAGLLRRTYGGALKVSPLVEPTIATRSARNVQAKHAIAERAALMVEPGESIYLDNGTTVAALALVLARHSADHPADQPLNINVLTNGLEVARLLADVPGVRHVVLGGTYRPAGNSFTGPLTLDALQQFSISKAFLGVSGLAGGAFSVADLTESQVKSAVITRSQQVVVLMDSSKVGATDFARVCDLRAVDAVITEKRDMALAEQCDAAGVELLLAE